MKLVLQDEEMERQRYKVPPSGKMPRRDMAKDRQPAMVAVPGSKKAKELPSKAASASSQQQLEASKRKATADKKSSTAKKKQKAEE